MENKVVFVTVFDPPPIPIRKMDWSATTENYEPGDPIGHGETEAEAIKDLVEQIEWEQSA